MAGCQNHRCFNKTYKRWGCVCVLSSFPWLQSSWCSTYKKSLLSYRLVWLYATLRNDSPAFGDNLHHVGERHCWEREERGSRNTCSRLCIKFVWPRLFQICSVSNFRTTNSWTDVHGTTDLRKVRTRKREKINKFRERTCTEKRGSWKMSWLRLLTRSRQQLWQSARRRKSSATVEAAKGPEPPNGFLFNEKVRNGLFYIARTNISVVGIISLFM